MKTPTDSKAKKTYTVYPCNEFVNSINRMLSEDTPVKIVFAGDIGGDIVFSVKYLDLGLNESLVGLSHFVFRRNTTINLLGELLVIRNLDMFAERVMSKDNYGDLVRAHTHRDFGMKTSGDELLFQCHVSLIYKLVNDRLLWDIKDEVTKTKATIAAPKKINRSEESPSISAYSDSSGLKLTVPKTDELRVCLERAMELILDFYGIKGKDVLVTNNTCSFLIEVSDKNK